MLSEVQYVLLTLLYKYGINFTASMIIVFKLTILNYYFEFLNRQIHLKRLLNCVNYKIKLKQSNFERNAKNILGFEQICDTEKNCLLKISITIVI
jgi:hypothetical protein